jgi:hypothetical protein
MCRRTATAECFESTARYFGSGGPITCVSFFASRFNEARDSRHPHWLHAHGQQRLPITTAAQLTSQSPSVIKDKTRCST